MEGGRVNHSWFMGVASHSHVGLGGGMDGGGVWFAFRTKPGGVGWML